MNKYFKKFSIMFVMALVLMLGSCVSALAATDDYTEMGTEIYNAKIGQKLEHPEKGWKRYDDANEGFNYSSGNWNTSTADGNWYNLTRHYNLDVNSQISFKFKGSKFRLIGPYWSSTPKKMNIMIDGVTETINTNSSLCQKDTLLYNKDLDDSIHEVIISGNNNNETSVYSMMDAIDIDAGGYLVPYNQEIQSILLDNTTLTIPVDNTQQLAASTTPAGAKIDWSSDNTGIATVEQDGTIKGIKEGQATITAKIKGTNIKATCVVTVTPKGKEPNPPAGDGNLFIELVDGQIKSYQVTASQIEDFKQWYLDRDDTKSNKPYYHFTKGSYNDYVIHDKIDWFEVR